MIIKTIDINAWEWFDKVNGNSYFSAEVILNFGYEDQVNLKIPFQYGYGDHYVYMGFKEIEKFIGFKIESNYDFVKNNKIILRTHKTENCRKRDLMNN